MGKYESPEYRVTCSDNAFELRQYKDFYIIEYDNDADPDITQGFGTLFNYISNDNKEKQKIAMTVPVIEEMTDSKMKMAFVAPAKFGEHVPAPNNKYLNVRKFDSGEFAVIRYSGTSNTKKQEQMIQHLQVWLRKIKHIPVSNFMLAYYNPPFIPPMFRRNEILVRVEPK